MDAADDVDALVTVIITTKNRSALVSEAVASVLATERRGFDVDVLVVDDGSTDDTPEVLARLAAADPAVRTMRTSTDGTSIGMAGARNAGIDAAKGSFVLLLDDDDLLLPAAIGAQLALFAERPELGSVHGQAQRTIMETGELVDDPFPEPPLSSGWLFEDLLTYFPQIGTVLTRTSVAREVGGFDPTLTGDNDWHWNLRIAKRHQVGRVAVPVILFRHRSGAEEALAWRRFPAMVRIFREQTADLPWRTRLRLRPILWHQRGWWAWSFVSHGRKNWRNGERKRAMRSFGYALRASPLHALRGFFRRA